MYFAFILIKYPWNALHFVSFKIWNFQTTGMIKDNTSLFLNGEEKSLKLRNKGQV